jgi:hypothetical protein
VVTVAGWKAWKVLQLHVRSYMSAATCGDGSWLEGGRWSCSYMSALVLWCALVQGVDLDVDVYAAVDALQ